MDFEENIKKLNIKLPEAKAPAGNYVATKIVGNLLYISGQISIDENGELIKGKIGSDIDTDKAYKDRDGLIKETGIFLETLHNKNYNPRSWVLNNAIPLISHKKWKQTMIDFQKLSGWELLS